MKKSSRMWAVSVALLIIFLTGNCLVQAHEPRLVEYKVLKYKRSGLLSPGIQRKGDAWVKVQLFATKEDSRNWILVVFPGSIDPQVAGRPVANLDAVIEKGASPEYFTGLEDPGPLWREFVKKDIILIPPGRAVKTKVFVDFLRRGDGGVNPQLHAKAYVVDAKDVSAMGKKPERLLAQLLQTQQPAAWVAITDTVSYRIKGDTWVAGSFKKIFGAPSEDELVAPSTGDYDKNAKSLPVVVKDYRSSLPLPGDFKDDGGKLFEQTLSEVYRSGSGEAGEEFCDKEDIKSSQRPKTHPTFRVSHNLSGKFSSKWASDHSLHPGFGWRVEAWTQEDGPWEKLASDWVQSDGTWSLAIPDSKGYQGDHLRMYYRAYNNYYQPQNQDGNKYSWRDPDQYNIGASFYAGHRYADTDGGSANGLGDLYDAGYRMWSRLYWAGGINPVPSSPLKVYYPNTWDNCGGASPWSCANRNGEIWLIAAHGTDAPTVVHEMSHQLNNKFWDGKYPANTGGNHNLTSCYPGRLGMTLREGFADFMPGWVGYQNRNVAEGGFNSTQWNLGYDVESRNSPPNCANGWEAEVWVARTFWDLHDTRSDGDDILWFIHKGAVISLYLANGIANEGDARDMRDYENVYRNAATPGHEGFITDIFEQNRH